MKMSTILVTGGAGFVGSHTSLLLLKKGYKLIILDSLINSSEISLKRVSKIVFNEVNNKKLKFIKGDIRDKNLLDGIFKEAHLKNNKFDGVIHFAGLKAAGESVKYPLEYWDSNVNGSLTLFKVMEKYDCRNLVFSSSATVYKAQSSKLLNEYDALEPVNPYGYTKFTIERILSNLFNSKKSQWRIACLRYFNPVGAHESGFIGENPLGKFNNLYPQITRVAIGKKNKINIFGSDWDTKDGTCVRDYIHVMDLAEGHLLAMNYLTRKDPQFIAINIGTGIGTSVLEFIRIFEKVNNVEIPFSFEERRLGDNSSVIADNSLAKSLLEWMPKRNIEDACRDGWNWQLKNPNGYI